MKDIPMPTNPRTFDKKPAEAARETIDHERKKPAANSKAAGTKPRAPGDEAAPGTAGTGEDVCPQCKGTGQLNAKPCPKCNGSGRVIKAIGGA
jgi:DnaJ-class molecular chaperone